MTLEPMTAGPDHVDAATVSGAVVWLVVPCTNTVVSIGEIGRFQAVT